MSKHKHRWQFIDYDRVSYAFVCECGLGKRVEKKGYIENGKVVA